MPPYKPPGTALLQGEITAAAMRCKSHLPCVLHDLLDENSCFSLRLGLNLRMKGFQDAKRNQYRLTWEMQFEVQQLLGEMLTCKKQWTTSIAEIMAKSYSHINLKGSKTAQQCLQRTRRRHLWVASNMQETDWARSSSLVHRSSSCDGSQYVASATQSYITLQ